MQNRTLRLLIISATKYANHIQLRDEVHAVHVACPWRLASQFGLNDVERRSLLALITLSNVAAVDLDDEEGVCGLGTGSLPSKEVEALVHDELLGITPVDRPDERGQI